MNLASVAGEPDRRLVFVSFNQDSSSLAVGTKDGYQLYSLNNVDKLELIHRNEVEKEACIVARLFSSSLIAVVSLASPRKLKVCHFKKETEICNYSYSNSILAVKLNRQRLIVCLEESLYVHNIRDMKVIHTIRSISANPNGLCDLSCSNECSYLAYPGSSRSGTVQIFDTITLRSVATIPAHDNPLAALSFNLSGNKIATASEKGTVIRVFSVPDGAKLFEFRRGVKRCVTISSLAFSADSLFLAASSNTETVHVFKLEKKEDRPTEEPHSWTGYVTSAFKSSASYLPTQVTEVFNQFRAFATCRLDQSGLRTICSLTTIQKVLYVLVVSEDGMLHAFTLDPLDGGDCKSIKAHRIDVLESISARRDSNADRPLLSQKKSSPPSAEKTRTKSSSDSPASDSQSYQDVETAGGSPPDALKLDDDSEFPPMSPHDS